MALSDTQKTILNLATRRPDGFAVPPAHLPAAPRAAVARALIIAGLVVKAELSEAAHDTSWKLDGESVALRITEAGREAVGQAPSLTAQAPGGASDTAAPPPIAPHNNVSDVNVREVEVRSPAKPNSKGLHKAAEALLVLWDAGSEGEGLANAVDALRAAMHSAARTRSGSALPRTETKRANVLGLLRRSEGATVTQVAAATGWATPTVHGFFAGLRKNGVKVEVLERVRQVGPGKQGASGSYAVYRVTEAG